MQTKGDTLCEKKRLHIRHIRTLLLVGRMGIKGMNEWMNEWIKRANENRAFHEPMMTVCYELGSLRSLHIFHLFSYQSIYLWNYHGINWRMVLSTLSTDLLSSWTPILHVQWSSSYPYLHALSFVSWTHMKTFYHPSEMVFSNMLNS